MLYQLVRPVARYVLRYYYRNIDITGLENIPRDAPVILAANHPTAFIEPCLLACFQPRTLHFLARGDLYKNRLATATLRALNILPVYRIQDGGYDKLVRNYDTFAECYASLSRGQAVMILAEGRCIHEKRLRPLRKGTARIALGAIEHDTTLNEVYVVPVGVNFSAAERFRSAVSIRCGKAIAASEYLGAYRTNPANGIRLLTDRLRNDLSPLVLQVPAAADDGAYDQLLEVVRNELAPELVGVTHDGSVLTRQLAVPERPPGAWDTLLRYAARLKSHGIRDRDLRLARPTRMPYPALPAALLLLPLLPLWGLAEAIALAKPRTVEFYSPVRFAVVAVGTLLYLPLVLLLPWGLKVYVLLSLLLVNWSLRTVERLLDWRGGRRVAQLPAATRADLLAARRGCEAIAPGDRARGPL